MPRTFGKSRFGLPSSRLLMLLALMLLAFSFIQNVWWIGRLAPLYIPTSSFVGVVVQRTNSSLQSWMNKHSVLIPEEADFSVQQLATSMNWNASGIPALTSCSPTCQVRIDMSKKIWVLQSLDCHGNEKIIGGDEFYISYSDQSKGINSTTAVAIVDDLQDGTYLLDFVTPPLDPNPKNLTGIGTLFLHLQYTCGVGRLAPPSKRQWKTGGYVHTTYNISGVEMPSFRRFEPPQSLLQARLGQYRAVVALGDSVMGQLVGDYTSLRKVRSVYKTNLRFSRSVGRALNQKSVEPTFLGMLIQNHGPLLTRLSHDGALLLGSSTWDLLDAVNEDNGPNFEDHRMACRRLVLSIRDHFPNTTLFWKSPTAMHIHVVDLEALPREGIKRIQYMSASRSRDLYRIQKEEMAQLNVTYLDLYETTLLSAQWTLPGDGRHYLPSLNLEMLDWMYSPPESVRQPNLQNNNGAKVDTTPPFQVSSVQDFL